MQEPIKFYGVKEAVKILQQFEPEALNLMRREIRQIANPAVMEIKSITPKVSPFANRSKDGMSHTGRTAWSAVSVRVAITPKQKSRKFGSTTANLATINSNGSNKQFGFNIADMAGKANNVRYGGMTRVYRYKDTIRQHEVNGQGRSFIENLPGRPSRYVYKAIESKLPQIYAEVAEVIEKAITTANRKLNR